MGSKLSIKVNVADRFYPLKIDKSDEEKIRKAAKMINDKVLQYKKKYTDKDIQDFLAMASLQFVIKLLEADEKTNDDLDVNMITELIDNIDEFLNNIN
ncbi:MAG: cell division protein ZapA [Bacteroidales bacterium]|jgi:cell division protein ZapA (FtsZ GTPase activity inhibitor)|nr:cell division protein ZapA [Bacteroidales bacterium]